MAATALKLESNRANAKRSTGPQTETGKSVSSQNACQHNLTGGPALAAGEDPSIYEEHQNYYEKQYAPKSLPEVELVRQLADAAWRLKRAARMECEILQTYPNPFLEPDSPMAIQLMRLTRYRSSIQRTYDRAAKELQTLIDAATLRRNQTYRQLRHHAAEQLKSNGCLTPDSDKIDRLAAGVLATLPPESARTVLAYRDRT